MEKIWLKSYPPGVPEEIDTSEFSSINDILRKSCEKFRQRPAFTCMDRSLSYEDLDQMSLRFAAYLQSLGLKKGDRVAIMMPNILQYPIALFGILRAGLIVVNTNPLYTPRELEHQLVDSGAKAIVILENFANVLEKVIVKTQVKHVITTQIGDLLGFPKSLLVNLVIKYKRKMVPAWNIPDTISLSKALSIGANATFAATDVSMDDLAFLQYTGGTTGVPKGAMLSHGNIVANLLQTSAWIGARFKEGEEVVITALPLYHIFSLTGNCLTFMKYGAQNILIINPRDMPGFVAELAKHPFTVITGVNTLFNGLLHTPGFEKLDFSGIKVSLGGGMAVQRAVAERWQQVTGQPLIEAYGLTETSPGACINPLNISGYNGTIGLPIPSTIITIRDDNCNILPIGEIGEICIAGPQVMKGYWNKDDETAKVMTPDGAIRSGDIGFMNADGFVKIVDRKKDMILVSGFNVYPNEIEDVIAMCPGVMEVCAVAAEDEKSGEVVRVAIVKKDPALTKEQVFEYCKTQLTGYKLPRIIEFWKELPKSNVGKVLRRQVKNMKAPAA
jgi:long-chain acyl-CoA synthetase